MNHETVVSRVQVRTADKEETVEAAYHLWDQVKIVNRRRQR